MVGFPKQPNRRTAHVYRHWHSGRHHHSHPRTPSARPLLSEPRGPPNGVRPSWLRLYSVQDADLVRQKSGTTLRSTGTGAGVRVASALPGCRSTTLLHGPASSHSPVSSESTDRWPETAVGRYAAQLDTGQV